MKNLPGSLIAASLLALSGCTPTVGLGPRAAQSRSVMVVASGTLHGSAGERIELAAWGFTGRGARVWFGRAQVEELRLVDGWRLEVVVPPGQGVVDVCVENGAGSWVLVEAFRYPEGSAVERCPPGAVTSARIEAVSGRLAELREARRNEGTRLAAQR